MSKIQWTNATWNPLTGCTRVSAGCDNCYAAREAAGRLKNTPAYQGLAVMTPSGRAAFNGTIRLLPDRLDQPLRWQRSRRVFVNSMSDLFHPDVPDEYIDRVFAVMAMAPRHTFQVLTKRPERMAAYMAGRDWGNAANRVTDAHVRRLDEPLHLAGEIVPPLPNVWLGTSVEDQAAAGERIPHLLRTPAAVRFLSCEPLLGPVDLGLICLDCDALILTHKDEGEHLTERGEGIHWVIVGGESGRGARPMDIAWARSLVAQCRAAGVPVFVKQLGARPVRQCHDCTCVGDEVLHCSNARIGLRDKKGGNPATWPEDLRVREYPEPMAAHA